VSRSLRSGFRGHSTSGFRGHSTKLPSETIEASILIARQEHARREARMRGMKILSSFIGGRIRVAMDRVTQEAQE